MSETELYGIKPTVATKRGAKLMGPMTIVVNRQDVMRMKQYFPQFNASFFFRTRLARALVDLDEQKKSEAITTLAKVKKKNGKA
jgi:hypothetical protein